MNLRPVCCANDEQLLLFARASAILQMKIQRSREEECVCWGEGRRAAAATAATAAAQREVERDGCRQRSRYAPVG